MAPRKSTASRKAVKRKPAASRKRIPRSKTERGVLPAQSPLVLTDAPVAALVAQVEKAGGRASGAYRDPLSGSPLVLAHLPLSAVEPTPFQRELSPTHTKRLAQKIEEAGVFLDPIITVPSPKGGFWSPNGRHRLAAARSLGLRSITALVSAERALSTADAMCREQGTLQRLRERGVRFILSVQPFANQALRLVDVASPARTAPLSIYVYELEHSLPDPTLWPSPDDLDARGLGRALDGALARYVESDPDFVRVAVETPREAYLILRRTNARGWSATVNGRPALLATANGRHQAVAVPPGTSDVVLSYRSPNARLGIALSLLSAAVATVLYLRSRAGHESTGNRLRA